MCSREGGPILVYSQEAGQLPTNYERAQKLMHAFERRHSPPSLSYIRNSVYLSCKIDRISGECCDVSVVTRFMTLLKRPGKCWVVVRVFLGQPGGRMMQNLVPCVPCPISFLSLTCVAMPWPDGSQLLAMSPNHVCRSRDDCDEKRLNLSE